MGINIKGLTDSRDTVNKRKEHIMKIVRFLKDWTLPVSIALGIAGYFLFAEIPALQPVCDWFTPISKPFLPSFMFLILFTVFCKVDFKKLRPVKWQAWVAVQQVVFVLILVGLILVFRLKGEPLILLEAILACVIGPCAAASSVITAKLGGSMEQMTTYTFISNFVTAIMIPVCFPLIEKGEHITFLSAFLGILYQVCVVLVVPMGLAFIVKHMFHRFHHWIISIKDLSFYLWGGSLVLVAGTTMRNIMHANTSLLFISVIAILGLMLCIIQFATGRFIGHYFDSTVESGQALGQKNTPFAIWAASAYLNPLATVGPGCYVLWQNLINSFELWHYQKKSKGGIDTKK